MPTKTPVDRAEEMIRPRLEESYDPQSLIALVPIHTDQDVADIGAGPGWLSLPLAKYLYGGHLYAIDIQEGMLEKLSERARRVHVSNIKTVISKESAIPLEDGIVNGAVMSDTLNEASRPKALFKEAVRLLRKGGWLAVVEWMPVEGEVHFGPPVKQRVPQEQVLEMGVEHGLTRLRSRQIGLSHYVVVFRK
jgi:ubiquinone/menaquinone biosynthesis C-methylase UbiE